MRLCFALALVVGSTIPAGAEEPFHSSVAIFPAETKHNHASCVVECPNGDLLAAWYSGSGERQADDVRILAARLRKGETAWGPRFLLADTPGYPDCNPALFATPDRTFWLFYPTILDHRWEGALLKFAMARNVPSGSGPPEWSREGVLHITPKGFDKAMAEALASLKGRGVALDESSFDKLAARSKDEL